MKKIVIDRAHAYSVGWCASLLILNNIYGIEDKVRLAYVVDDTIIGYITNKKVYSSGKGEYIVWGGHRRYLHDFISVLLYNKEYTQEARKTK